LWCHDSWDYFSYVDPKSNNNYGNNYNSAKEPTSPDERILDNSHSSSGYNTNNSAQANSIFNLGSRSLPVRNIDDSAEDYLTFDFGPDSLDILQDSNNSAQTQRKRNSEFGGGFKRKSRKPLKSKKPRKTKRRSHKYTSKIRK
jgi:hypothetical protein